jgi:hypothetical protein
MPKKRHTPEQIINKLRDADAMLASASIPTVQTLFCDMSIRSPASK